MKALIVDDSRTARSVVRRVLQGLGWETYEAADGQEAHELLDQLGGVDLALVDWNMPVLDGLGFVRKVRSDPRWAGLRLMMVTAETEPAQLSLALEAGASEYLMKPFTRDMILGKLAILGLVS